MVPSPTNDAGKPVDVAAPVDTPNTPNSQGTGKDDAKKLALCSGCRDDFYNDQNPLGVKRCWSLKTAQVVERLRIGWWTQQDSAKNFKRVTTLDCHYAPGRYAHVKELPAHLRVSK